MIGDAAQPYGDKVEADFQSGVDSGVRGTPALFLDGRPYDGPVELSALRSAVRRSAGLRAGPASSADRFVPGPGWQSGSSCSVPGGAHTPPRSPRNWKTTKPSSAASERPGQHADDGLVPQRGVGERQVGDEQRDGEPDPGQGGAADELTAADVAGQQSRPATAALPACCR